MNSGSKNGSGPDKNDVRAEQEQLRPNRSDLVIESKSPLDRLLGQIRRGEVSYVEVSKRLHKIRAKSPSHRDGLQL